VSEQDRKKAWFVEGLRLLPDKIRLIEMHHTSSLLASRRCREKATGDFMADAAAYRNHPDVIAWKTYQDDIVTELDAAVRVGGEFAVDLHSCRKLSIALSQGFYQDDSTFILDAITEVCAVADKLSIGAPSDGWVLVKVEDMKSAARQKAWRHQRRQRPYQTCVWWLLRNSKKPPDGICPAFGC
jgi:hypothetical protein